MGLCNRIRYIPQLTGSDCGQTCLAMVLRRSRQAIYAHLGHGRTKTKQLTEVLQRYGVPVPNRAVVLSRRNPLPRRCIAKCHVKDCKAALHWIVCWKGRIYDPRDGRYDSQRPINARRKLSPMLRITSYIPLP